MTSHHLGDDILGLVGLAALDDDRRKSVEDHVATCPLCRAAVAAMASVVEGLDRLPTTPVSSAFDQQLFERLDEIDRQRDDTKTTYIARLWAWFTPRRVLVAVAACGAVALVVATSALIRSEFGRSSEIPTDAAEFAEFLELADDLDLYRDLVVVENIDVLDDLDIISEVDEDVLEAEGSG